MAHHQLGDQDGDLPVGMVVLDLKDVVDQGKDDETVGGAEQDQLGWNKACGSGWPGAWTVSGWT